jgi:hypothetical protein
LLLVCNRDAHLRNAATIVTHADADTNGDMVPTWQPDTTDTDSDTHAAAWYMYRRL